MSLTKYQIKDKFIKDVSRYYILEESKEKITPNKIYIRKGNRLYYIEKRHMEYLTKEQIINLKGSSFFEKNISGKYFKLTKKSDFFDKEERLNIYFHIKSAYKTDLFDNPKVRSYLVHKSKILLENIEENLYFVMGRYNLNLQEILKWVFYNKGRYRSFDERFEGKEISFTHKTLSALMSLLEDEMTFPIEVEKYKSFPVYNKKEETYLQYILDIDLIPEDLELSSLELRKYYNKPTFESTLKNLYHRKTSLSAPKWYRKMLNKKVKLNGKKSLNFYLKNGNLNDISVLEACYVRDGSRYW